MKPIETLIQPLFDTQHDAEHSNDMAALCDWLVEATDQQLADFCTALRARVASSNQLVKQHFITAIRTVVDGQRRQSHPMDVLLRKSLLELYGELGGECSFRWVLLQWLAVSGRMADLAALAERILADPPRDARGVALALAPLFQSDRWEIAGVFPRLLDAIATPLLASPVLDLANYVTRRGWVDRHPAADRCEALVELLGALVQRLAKLEETPVPAPQVRSQQGRQVDETVAIVISLCDALALIGSERAIGKLYQALSLHHRRLRAEAAAALARLGDEEGRKILIGFAAEPVTRLRVLADAEELGIADQIDPQYTTPEARAEAEVALALAQPSYFGMPPLRVEHVYAKELYWPGHTEPVVCHLVRYEYQLDRGHYANIAICGPVTHALTANLNDLSPDDILAVYAGWHTEHEEIYEVEPAHWSPEQQTIAQNLVRQLDANGFTRVEPVFLATILGYWVLVARVEYESNDGIAVVDASHIEFSPNRSTAPPMSPQEIYLRYKGRYILRQFNS